MSRVLRSPWFVPAAFAAWILFCSAIAVAHRSPSAESVAVEGRVAPVEKPTAPTAAKAAASAKAAEKVPVPAIASEPDAKPVAKQAPALEEVKRSMTKDGYLAFVGKRSQDVFNTIGGPDELGSGGAQLFRGGADFYESMIVDALDAANADMTWRNAMGPGRHVTMMVRGDIVTGVRFR